MFLRQMHPPRLASERAVGVTHPAEVRTAEDANVAEPVMLPTAMALPRAPRATPWAPMPPFVARPDDEAERGGNTGASEKRLLKESEQK